MNIPARLWEALVTAVLVVTFCASSRATAQLVPSDRWYTIETAHFRVHFVKALEPEARRGAVNAERAFAQLSTELKAPRGKVDLVIADNVDYVNGYATSFPSNRIVIFAHPPVDAPQLRNYDDWSQLVITHELTHIFHLDRADGIWRLGRNIFGRHPALFPNSYLPSWLLEGLAVYYESRITGEGRLEGSEHYMIARAAAQERRIPRLGEISRETSRFPGGEVVYIYGGFLFDYLSRTRGPQDIPKFVDITSRSVFPLSLNAKAKLAFGISFENALKDWGDSLARAAPHRTDPLPGWRQLTNEGRNVESPRWSGDTAIIYVASNGRETAGAYRVLLNGSVTRLDRRNGLDVNVPLADGGILFSQPDYTDPFHYRADLYLSHEGRETRLTYGARLTSPDARRDGEIIAVQSVPGSTRLVRVSGNGKRINPITVGTQEVQWGDPRWSPDGQSIAAIRLRRGGINEIVTLDTTGLIKQIVVSEHAIVSSPAWSRSGESLFYTSTRTGATQAYTTRLDTRAVAQRLSNSTTGLFSLEPSPDGKKFAALDFRFDGYHVGYSPASSAVLIVDSTTAAARAGCTNCRLVTDVPPPIGPGDPGPARKYSPWQSLAPRYWEPLVTIANGSGNFFGAATSGEDLIGRHVFYANAGFNTKYRQAEVFGDYQYAGFGQPFLNFSAQQAFDHFSVFNPRGANVGSLARRARIYGLSASFVRPRARTYSSLAFGSELESRNYTTDPDTLLAKLPALYSATLNYPSVVASGSWSNVQRPTLSISREDGFSMSATTRRRWQSGNMANGSNSIIGVLGAYKSLNLPGFAHHVLALRVAGAAADRNAISTFSAGGLSGGSLQILSGVSVGADRRTFGVRGFPPSAEQGTRALGGTAEYRAPLSNPSARIPFIPVLFDKISVSAFGEAGRAWCPAGTTQSPGVCGSSTLNQPWLASVGAEADFDTAIQYDVPARFRAGFAIPVASRPVGNARSVSVYLTLGGSF